VKQRRESPPTTPDIFSWLLNGFENLDHPTPQDEVNLVGTHTWSSSLGGEFLLLNLSMEAQR
jgi:hypothetical protein